MEVMLLLRSIVAMAACASLGACSSSHTGGVGGEGDCVSRYYDVTTAPTWPALKSAMLKSRDWGRVDSIRIQQEGVDVGAGDQDAVRVVDLLDQDGQRLIQVDVWRTDAGAWRAGAWGQCTD